MDFAVLYPSCGCVLAEMGGLSADARFRYNARPPCPFFRHGVDDAPVAQPDRVVASEAIGRGFESLQAHHFCDVPCGGFPAVEDAMQRMFPTVSLVLFPRRGGDVVRALDEWPGR